VSRAELDRRERQWQAERATLEEFYEATARTQAETAARLRDSALALRRENEGQLQLLQAARKALGDLRNRFDLASAQWNDERGRLEAAAERVSSRLNHFKPYKLKSTFTHHCVTMCNKNYQNYHIN
jgi:hypothetical protein